MLSLLVLEVLDQHRPVLVDSNSLIRVFFSGCSSFQKLGNYTCNQEFKVNSFHNTSVAILSFRSVTDALLLTGEMKG